MVKAFGIDDWLMTFSMVSACFEGAIVAKADLSKLSFICYSTFSSVGVHFGTGHHRWDLSDENWESAMKVSFSNFLLHKHLLTTAQAWWFCFLFYAVTMISSKLSIGFFLLRITVKKIHIWIVYASMAISVLAGTVFFFVCLFQCHPVSFFWKIEIPGGTCININVIIGLAYLYSVFSVISDFTFALLPGFLIWDLQLARTTKVMLFPLLAMGCM